MANEDFTTYTEIDPGNDYTVTSTKVDVDTIDQGAVSCVRKDMGAAHYNGDFIHQFEFFISDSGSRMHFHTVSDIESTSWINLVDQNGYALSVYEINGTSVLYLLESGTPAATDTGSVSNDVLYFATLIRLYSTNEIILYFRTGSHEGPLIDTLLIDGLNPAIDYRYQYVCQNQGSSTGDSTCYVQNLNLNEEAASPSGQIMRILAYNGMHQVILQGVILS